MRVKRIALHQLYPNTKKGISSLHNSFDKEAYSKFKYGDTRIAQHYAESLTQKLLQNPAYLQDNTATIYITSSAFRHVPTAAQSILNAFLETTKAQLSSLKLQYFKIHRNYLDGRDYAQLTSEERERVLNQANLFIDDKVNLGNQKVWVIDDIRITGKHEEKILKFLQKLGVEEVKFLYVANLQQGTELSWLEHYINHAWVKDLERLEQIVQLPYFQANARVCKFLLSYPCHASLKAFLEKLDLSKITVLFKAVKHDSFDKVENYKSAFLLLENIFHQKNDGTGSLVEVYPESLLLSSPAS